ncbi:hypothetical protein CP532_0615 [Ophiocordyceps camponoti-leonardi (nom. inval.)]|nr:hypothetical protein CP532_0615 [Ophiocordyceps camponoti-leonardi (nom. inval.)]
MAQEPPLHRLLLLLLSILLTLTLHPLPIKALPQGQSQSHSTTIPTGSDAYRPPLSQLLHASSDPPETPEVAPGLRLVRGRYEFQGPAGGMAKVPLTAEEMRSRLDSLQREVLQRETRLGYNRPTQAAAGLDDFDLDTKIQDSARAQHKAWKLFKSEKSESFRHESVQIGILTLKYRQIADLKRDLEAVTAVVKPSGDNALGGSSKSPPLSPGSYASSRTKQQQQQQQEQQPSRPQPTRRPKPSTQNDDVRPPRQPPKHEPVSQPPPLGPPRRKESSQSLKPDDSSSSLSTSSKRPGAPVGPPPRKPNSVNVNPQPQRQGFPQAKNGQFQNQIQAQVIGSKLIKGGGLHRSASIK